MLGDQRMWIDKSIHATNNSSFHTPQLNPILPICFQFFFNQKLSSCLNYFFVSLEKAGKLGKGGGSGLGDGNGGIRSTSAEICKMQIIPIIYQ